MDVPLPIFCPSVTVSPFASVSTADRKILAVTSGGTMSLGMAQGSSAASALIDSAVDGAAADRGP